MFGGSPGAANPYSSSNPYNGGGQQSQHGAYGSGGSSPNPYQGSGHDGAYCAYGAAGGGSPHTPQGAGQSAAAGGAPAPGSGSPAPRFNLPAFAPKPAGIGGGAEGEDDYYDDDFESYSDDGFEDYDPQASDGDSFVPFFFFVLHWFLAGQSAATTGLRIMAPRRAASHRFV